MRQTETSIPGPVFVDESGRQRGVVMVFELTVSGLLTLVLALLAMSC